MSTALFIYWYSVFNYKNVQNLTLPLLMANQCQIIDNSSYLSLLSDLYILWNIHRIYSWNTNSWITNFSWIQTPEMQAPEIRIPEIQTSEIQTT